MIAVDWRDGAHFKYQQAVGNIQVVAAETAKLLEYILQGNSTMSPSDIHIIGHSIGAHCAGEIGARMRTNKIGRITGA